MGNKRVLWSTFTRPRRRSFGRSILLTRWRLAVCATRLCVSAVPSGWLRSVLLSSRLRLTLTPKLRRSSKLLLFDPKRHAHIDVTIPLHVSSASLYLLALLPKDYLDFGHAIGVYGWPFTSPSSRLLVPAPAWTWLGRGFVDC